MEDSQLRFFDENGFVVIDTQIPNAILDNAANDVEGLFLNDHEKQKLSGDVVTYRDSIRIQDAWKVSENVKSIALSDTILHFLEQAYGRNPRPFQTLNFKIGTQQKAHSDTIHFNSIPSGYMCGVWVALEDIKPDSGPLMYYPGSHKLEVVTNQHFLDEKKTDLYLLANILMTRTKTKKLFRFIRKMMGKDYRVNDPMSDRYEKYENYIEKFIQDHGLEPEIAIIKKGQALIWAANLLHGGSVIADDSLTRMSQVTHYYFDDCKYFTPILSDQKHTYWRQPEWITP